MLAAEQDRARAPHRNGRNDREQQWNEPHAETGVAEDRRAGADDEGHHRRMVVIAPGKGLRPLPVIGFIERKRRDRSNDAAHDNEDGKSDGDDLGSAVEPGKTHFARHTNRVDIE